MEGWGETVAQGVGKNFANKLTDEKNILMEKYSVLIIHRPIRI